MKTVRVLLADDHPVVLTGLVALLEDDDDLEVVGTASDGDEAVDLAVRLQPDVVLMDLRMPRLNGVEATACIVEQAPSTAVVVVTTSDDREDVVAAIEAGARGYVLKQAAPSALIDAIRSAAAGEMVMSPAATAALADRLRQGPAGPVEALTDRELEVLGCAARGQSNLQIARELFIAEATVKTHLQRVFDKLGVRDRTGAVTTAIRLGLISAGG
ncbi:MAG: response regulator [Desertimonas sp.]